MQNNGHQTNKAKILHLNRSILFRDKRDKGGIHAYSNFTIKEEFSKHPKKIKLNNISTILKEDNSIAR